MIARHWRGWTEPRNADAYESLLKDKVLPGLRDIAGYRGGYVLRSNGPSETEFVVINFFDCLAAVEAFAGPTYSTPVFEPEAIALLSRIEPIANHYEVRAGAVSRDNPSPEASCTRAAPPASDRSPTSAPAQSQTYPPNPQTAATRLLPSNR